MNDDLIRSSHSSGKHFDATEERSTRRARREDPAIARVSTDVRFWKSLIMVESLNHAGALGSSIGVSSRKKSSEPLRPDLKSPRAIERDSTNSRVEGLTLFANDTTCL